MNSDFFFYWHGLIKTPVFLLLRLEDGMEAVDVVVVRSSWSCSTFSPFTKGSSSSGTSSLQPRVLTSESIAAKTTAEDDYWGRQSRPQCDHKLSSLWTSNQWSNILLYLRISLTKKIFFLIYTAPLKTNFYNLGVNISREMMYYYSSSSLFTLLGLALEEFTVCLHLPSSLFTSDLWIPWCHFQPRFIPQLYTNDIWRSVRITNTRELSSSHHHTRHINS